MSRVDVRSFSDVRANFSACLDDIEENGVPLIVTRRRGKQFVIIDKEDYDGWQETLYLVSTPANARALAEAIAQADAGQFVERELIE